jgi:hypothetical protein
MSAVLGYVCLVLRGTVAVVFAMSALSKVRSRSAYARYRRATGRLTGLPRAPAAALAPVVVAVEAFVAVTAGIGRFAAVGLGVAGVLLCAFTVALARSPASAQALECGCFGSSAGAARHTAVARNLLLLGVVLGGLATTFAVTVSTTIEWGVVAVCAVAVAMLAAFIVRFEAIMSVFAPRL